MNSQPISPKVHALTDYVLAGSLLLLPTVLGLNKKAVKIYVAEALILLPYIALTKTPVALKPMIPLRIHKKIDAVNIAQFALQTIFNPIRRDRKALLLNLAFTLITGVSVLLTDWNEKQK